MSTPAVTGLAVLLAPEQAEASAALAGRLQLPLCQSHSAGYPYFLQYTDQGLALVPAERQAGKPFVVDLVGGSHGHRRQSGGGELLVKAIGGPRRAQPTVLDATAGFGGDSLVLASWGYRVTAVERCGWVHALLADGLARARLQAEADPALAEVLNRLQLRAGDARELLSAPDAACDVVYLDPMFPESDNTARVKKPMRALQTLLGPDPAPQALWQQAMQVARHRVVVKRALKAPELGDRPVSVCFRGKAVRFDVYSKAAWR